MPPIADTKDSRLRFLDLDPLLAEIRGPEGTAWVPESARVLRSGAYQFLDEPYIEQVIVAKYGCPEMRDNFLDNYGGQNVSRASVNFLVRKVQFKPWWFERWLGLRLGLGCCR